jgi:hypothetical protein
MWLQNIPAIYHIFIYVVSRLLYCCHAVERILLFLSAEFSEIVNGRGICFVFIYFIFGL